MRRRTPPTVKLSTVRCVLAYAAQLVCSVYQMDIKTAYLNAPIEEEVFLRQPEGFEVTSPDAVLFCRLKKSLYGLKQAGRNWYLTISEHLVSLGFVASLNDHCLFIKKTGGFMAFVCLWVDDLIYFSPDDSFYGTFEKQIAERFTISDQSKLCWFLGMKVEFSGDGSISLSQEQYIVNLLKKFGMHDCKLATSPGVEKIKFSREDCPEVGSAEQKEMREHEYRGLIGSLNYLSTTTRPDISYVAHQLSSFLENPGLTHWTAPSTCCVIFKVHGVINLYSRKMFLESV